MRPGIKILVRDTGPGIPEDQQQTIREPFTQMGKSVNEFGGVGIGLSLTKRLVETHKGWLTLESEVGERSAFTIHLPCFDPEAAS